MDTTITEQVADELASLTFLERWPDGQWLVLDEDGSEHGLTYDTLDQAVAFAWVWLRGGETRTNREQPIKAGYVQTDLGQILAQLPADNQWGFVLADDDQTWPGGLGAATEWELLANDDPRITDADRERLSWLLEEIEA
jgi:hypothetical protein